MAVKVEIIGEKAILKKLDELPEKIKVFVSGEIDRAVTNIHTNAVNDAPVRFSFLKNSITKEAEGLVGEVRVGAHYGPYMEFGTGGLVDVPAGLEDYAIQFKGAGPARFSIAPRPFLFPNFFREVKILNERLNKGLKDYL